MSQIAEATDNKQEVVAPAQKEYTCVERHRGYSCFKDFDHIIIHIVRTQRSDKKEYMVWEEHDDHYQLLPKTVIMNAEEILSTYHIHI